MIWKIIIVLIIVCIVGGILSEYLIDRKAKKLIKERDNLNLKTAFGRQERDRLNNEINRLYGFE